MMIDTHTHLYLQEFDTDGHGTDAVRRAMAIGVEQMIFPNVDLSTIEPMETLAAMFPGQISCAMGLHPTEIGDNWRQDLQLVFDRLGNGSRYVAVGEVGIDLYWDSSFREAQMQAFDIQAAKAQELGLPLIIHCRNGLDEVLEVLAGHRTVAAVFHSFGGDASDIKRIREIGDYYFGINGIVTFKNSRLREVLPEIGLDRILLETDSPYLAPVPNRGKRNESAYLPHIAAHIAQHLGLTTSEVAEATTKNARQLFRRLCAHSC